MTPVKPRIPPAPPGFDKDRFFAGHYWFQKWQVFDGVYTPGFNPIDILCQDLRLPDDLSGKRVLDIGAWNGCLSLECERRGAREVIALGPEDPHLTGFYRLRDAVGATRTHFIRGSVYDLNPAKLGYFDVVLFCGVLYHLRHPLLGIDNIRRVCVGDVYVETVVSDAQMVMPQGQGVGPVPMVYLSPDLLNTPVWQFYRHDEFERDPSNWFSPNATAVLHAFESAGFATELLKNWGRATFRGRVREGLPEWLALGTGEGVYYDIIIKSVFGQEKDAWEISRTTCPNAAPSHETVKPGTFLTAYKPEHIAKMKTLRPRLRRWLKQARDFWVPRRKAG